MNFIVYKHEAPNGKVYIGITSQSPSRRWRPNGKGYDRCPHMKRAIGKYGWDNFKHEILFEGLTKEDAEQKETELIAKYKANDPEHGFNIENGGHINKLTEAQKEHLRKINLGKHHSEETKRKISEGNKGKRKLTAEDKAKMRAGRSYDTPPWNKGITGIGTKKVAQYDLEGNLIRVYDSVTEARNITGATHLSECDKGKRKTDKGFIWKYIK